MSPGFEIKAIRCLVWICDIGGFTQHQDDSSVANLLLLSLATPDIPCFLLLDDLANELLLPVGLGTDRHFNRRLAYLLTKVVGN